MNQRNNRDHHMMDAATVFSRLRAMAPLPTGIAPSGRLSFPVRCLLCDIYGTLLISDSGDIGLSRQKRRSGSKLSALLADFGCKMKPERVVDRFHDAVEAAHRKQQAQGIEHPEVVIENIWQQLLFPGDLSRARNFALAYELLVNPIWQMPGLRGLLRTARCESLLIGVVSNAQFYTPMILEYLAGGDLSTLGFDPDLLILSYQHGLAKPSRRLFQMALDRLEARGVKARETVYVGNDMRNDIEPAKSAGFQTVLFAGDKRSLRLRQGNRHCHRIKPDLIVTHLSQLARELRHH